jgi:hypothetical protein
LISAERTVWSDIYLLAQGLGLAALSFHIHPFFPGSLSWPGGAAAPEGYQGIPDDLTEPFQGIRPVLLLGAVLLGLDDENPVLGQPLVAHGQQALFHTVGQRGTADIKAQMDGAGDLVDILAPGAAGPDKMELDFIIGDVYGVYDLEHGDFFYLEDFVTIQLNVGKEP